MKKILVSVMMIGAILLAGCSSTPEHSEELKTNWASIHLIPAANCQDKVVCYIVVNNAFIADSGGTCFYNETELLKKYCGTWEHPYQG